MQLLTTSVTLRLRHSAIWLRSSTWAHLSRCSLQLRNWFSPQTLLHPVCNLSRTRQGPSGRRQGPAGTGAARCGRRWPQGLNARADIVKCLYIARLQAPRRATKRALYLVCSAQPGISRLFQQFRSESCMHASKYCCSNCCYYTSGQLFLASQRGVLTSFGIPSTIAIG
jgi:hypothetical protein